MRAAGVKVFISTGRHIDWVDNLGDTEFDGYVTVNGAMCLLADKSTCIYKKCIDSSDIRRLVPFAQSHTMPIVVVPAQEEIFITAIDDSVLTVRDMLHIKPIPVKSITAAPTDDTVQLMAFAPMQERTESGLFSHVLTHCIPTSWNPYFCDICPQGSDKAVGMERMAAYFGISMDETMAFGDGDNDISMIEAAGVGVAMGNAAPEVQAKADFVTTAVDNHGVLNALRHFGLPVD